MYFPKIFFNELRQVKILFKNTKLTKKINSLKHQKNK